MMNLNEIAREVHENAVAHGWWAENRPFPEICALIHSEWSEALEEARAGRDMVWTGENGKPEGIAVELIDGVIRILDWMGMGNIDIFPATINSITEIWSKEMRDKLAAETLPQIVARLHCYTSNAYSENSNQDRADYLSAAMQTVFFWLDAKGVDVERVLITKHEYNKKRPYKHGKLF